MSNCFVPPYILTEFLESDDPEVREAAMATLLASERLRGERDATDRIESAAAAPADGRRSIFDCKHWKDPESARLVRSEDDGPVQDPSVNQLFDGFGITRTLCREVFERNSIDVRGGRLNGYVHYGNQIVNAIYFGWGMVFGDGRGRKFSDFTGSLDVIAHEFAHGVTARTANLPGGRKGSTRSSVTSTGARRGGAAGYPRRSGAAGEPGWCRQDGGAAPCSRVVA
jgi:hypothetical protein